MDSPSEASEKQLWVLCPVCHKANPAGTKYCEHCWGAVITSEAHLTAEEVEEATRHRQEYLRRRKIIKIATIGLSSLVVLGIIYLILYFSTDTVFKPPEGVNSNSLPGDWAMFRHDLGRTGSAGSVTEPPAGTQKWVFSTGAPVHSSPAVSNGTVFIGSQDYKLYALNADTGTKNWEYETGSWVESSPTVADGTVYFGSNDSYLYAVDTQSGEKIWDFKTAFPVKAGAAVAEDVIYFGSDDYYLYALDLATGRELWNFNVGSPAWSSPAVSDGIIYIGSANGYCYALNIKNGQRRLRFRSHYAIYSSPIVDEGTVYVVTTNGVLYVFDGMARTRYREHEIRPLWLQLYAMGIPGVPPPPTQSGIMWLKRFGTPATSSPVISDNMLYVGLENKLVAFDLRSREVQWEFEAEGIIRAAPALAGSTIYIGSEDGRLYAINASTGEKVWDFLTGDRITSSPAVVDGVVYVGSHDGNVYAIE